jgi:hypothetical protein
VQAKILRIVFKQYTLTGQKEFEWRELAAINELICDPYSTGLSTRLRRAMNCLAIIGNDIRLEKYGRGKYRLIFQKPLIFLEK